MSGGKDSVLSVLLGCGSGSCVIGNLVTFCFCGLLFWLLDLRHEGEGSLQVIGQFDEGFGLVWAVCWQLGTIGEGDLSILFGCYTRSQVVVAHEAGRQVQPLGSEED